MTPELGIIIFIAALLALWADGLSLNS